MTRKVIHLASGKIYNSCKEVAEKHGIQHNSVYYMMTKRMGYVSGEYYAFVDELSDGESLSDRLSAQMELHEEMTIGIENRVRARECVSSEGKRFSTITECEKYYNLAKNTVEHYILEQQMVHGLRFFFTEDPKAPKNAIHCKKTIRHKVHKTRHFDSFYSKEFLRKIALAGGWN